MRNAFRILISLCVILIIVVVSITQSMISWSKEDINRVVYHYQDASIPSENHRSFTIDVQKNQLDFTVTSYDVVLVDMTIETDPDILEQAVLFAHENHIKNKLIALPREQCTGASSERIILYDVDIIHLDVHAGNCLRKSNASGDIANFARSIKTLVPNFEELMDETRKNST